MIMTLTTRGRTAKSACPWLASYTIHRYFYDGILLQLKARSTPTYILHFLQAHQSAISYVKNKRVDTSSLGNTCISISNWVDTSSKPSVAAEPSQWQQRRGGGRFATSVSPNALTATDGKNETSGMRTRVAAKKANDPSLSRL